MTTTTDFETRDNVLSGNAIETYSVQLKRLVVKLGGYPADERAANAIASLQAAIAALGGETDVTLLDRLVTTMVEEPTDADGNPLPPPSPMELPQP